MAIDTLDRTTQWPAWAETTDPSPSPQSDQAPQAVHAISEPERLAAVQAWDPPARLSLHDVLTAWRLAERRLVELAEGSPEWAAVNATIISLRATYSARFDEYLEGESR